MENRQNKMENGKTPVSVISTQDVSLKSRKSVARDTLWIQADETHCEFKQMRHTVNSSRWDTLWIQADETHSEFKQMTQWFMCTESPGSLLQPRASGFLWMLRYWNLGGHFIYINNNCQCKPADLAGLAPSLTSSMWACIALCVRALLHKLSESCPPCVKWQFFIKKLIHCIEII